MLAKQGVRFVAVKVSEGTYYLNPYYKSDAGAAGAAGLQVMPYVFANPASGNGTATASYAVSAMGTSADPPGCRSSSTWKTTRTSSTPTATD